MTARARNIGQLAVSCPQILRVPTHRELGHSALLVTSVHVHLSSLPSLSYCSLLGGGFLSSWTYLRSVRCQEMSVIVRCQETSVIVRCQEMSVIVRCQEMSVIGKCQDISRTVLAPQECSQAGKPLPGSPGSSCQASC